MSAAKSRTRRKLQRKRDFYGASRYTFNSRTRKQNKGLMYRLGAILMLLIVLVGLFFALRVGVNFTWNLLFARNNRFKIQNIEIVGGRFKTEAMIREYFAYEGVAEGTNLFAFSIRDFRNAYLERNPLVKSIFIRRSLPDTLKITVREREPLVRLGQRGTLVVDNNGFVFRLSSNLHRLPVIIGSKDPLLKPGTFVRGRTVAALNVLSLCDKAAMGLRVVGIDIRNQDYLLLHVLTESGSMTEARLTWDGMDSGKIELQPDLLVQLNGLKSAARNNAGCHAILDVTFPDKIIAR